MPNARPGQANQEIPGAHLVHQKERHFTTTGDTMAEPEPAPVPVKVKKTKAPNPLARLRAENAELQESVRIRLSFIQSLSQENDLLKKDIRHLRETIAQLNDELAASDEIAALKRDDLQRLKDQVHDLTEIALTLSRKFKP